MQWGSCCCRIHAVSEHGMEWMRWHVMSCHAMSCQVMWRDVVFMSLLCLFYRIYGIASDPLKLQTFRALQHQRMLCLNDHICTMDDPVMRNFSRLLLKNSEHTWLASCSQQQEMYMWMGCLVYVWCMMQDMYLAGAYVCVLDLLHSSLCWCFWLVFVCIDIGVVMWKPFWNYQQRINIISKCCCCFGLKIARRWMWQRGCSHDALFLCMICMVLSIDGQMTHSTKHYHQHHIKRWWVMTQDICAEWYDATRI